MPPNDLRHLGHEILLAELLRADIDRQTQLPQVRGFSPQGQLAAGGIEHPVADLEDERAFLGERDELSRHDHAAFGMHPAHQYFGAQRAVFFAYLDLVMQFQLPVEHGETQIRFQRRTCLHNLLHDRVEETHGIASRFLRLVHRHVGALEQRVDRFLVAVVQADADAGRAVMLVLLEEVGGGQGRTQLFGDHGDFLGSFLRIAAEFLEQHHELVAAEARHGIFFAHLRLDAPRHFDQQLVAHIVTHGVVQVLEAVHVEEKHGAVLEAACRDGQRGAETVQQQAPVRQLGEDIVKGQREDLRLGALARGDVAEDGDILEDLVLLVPDGADGQPFRKDFAVLALVPDFAVPGPRAVQFLPHRPIELGVMLVR